MHRGMLAYMDHLQNRACVCSSPSVLSQLNDVKEHGNGFQYIREQPAGEAESEYLSALVIVAHHAFIYLQRQNANLTLFCGLNVDYLEF